MGDRIYVGGTFDLLHVGHLRLLNRAAKIGPVTVAVNTDQFAARYKRPTVVPLDHRIELLQALSCVDRVIVNTGDEDSKPAILNAQPRYIVHGDDWTGDAYLAQLGVTHAWLRGHNIDLLYLPYTKDISTTGLLAKAQQIEYRLHNFTVAA